MVESDASTKTVARMELIFLPLGVQLELAIYEYKNLYPIIRYLKIDANQIFYPESQQESPSIRQLSALINDCTEKEANAIYPLVESVIHMLRNQSAQNINA